MLSIEINSVEDLNSSIHILAQTNNLFDFKSFSP